MAVNDSEINVLIETSPKKPQNEQFDIFNRARAALAERTVSAELVDKLESRHFDAKQEGTRLLLRGLCHLSLGDNVECIKDLNQSLQVCPNDRTSTLYRAVARWRDYLDPNGSRYKEDISLLGWVRSFGNDVADFEVKPEDHFARLIKACGSLFQGSDSDFESEAAKVSQYLPQDTMSRAMIAAHHFHKYVLLGRDCHIEPAIQAACEVLRIDFNDKLSFSVLWWLTEGLGIYEFKGQLLHTRERNGKFREVYAREDIHPNKIFNIDLLAYDKLQVDSISAKFALEIEG